MTAPTVTGDQVRDAMIAAGITTVDHHDCGGCGYMTKYQREGDTLFFDAGCWCSRFGSAEPQPRTWDSAADWINMQSSAEVRNELRAKFGLPLEQPA